MQDRRPARCLGLVIAFAAACGSSAPTPQPPQPARPPVAAEAPPTSFSITSAQLGEARRINVYLPPGYAATTDRYAVLYMPDGGLEEDFPHVTATVDRLIRERAIRPLVVVGIENTERRRDLTGPTEIESDRAIAPRVGGSAAFRAFLRDELMPAIAAGYRVTDDTGIIGESLAGLFIVETFLLEPAMFRRAIALDPSLWWNRERLAGEAAAHLAAAPGAPRTLFLSSADEDNIVPVVARLADVVRTAPGVTLIFAPRPDLHHDTIYRAMSAPALQAVYPLR